MIAKDWANWDRAEQDRLLRAVAGTFPFAGRVRCVEATRLGRDLLRRLGVDAKPTPSYMAVFNKRFLDRVEAGTRPLDDPLAWSLGIHPTEGNRPVRQPIAGLGDTGYPGHLVLVIDGGPGWLLGLSAAQFDKPDVRLPMSQYCLALDHTEPAPPWYTLAPSCDQTSPRHFYRWDDGTAGIWVLNPDDVRLAGWRKSSAWRGDPPREAMDAWHTLTLPGFEMLQKQAAE